MSTFTPVPALIGGLLIGASAVVLLAGTGRIAGISNIAHGLVDAWRGRRPRSAWVWRLLFILGMITGAWLWFTITGRTVHPRTDAPSWLLILAGVLVGYGTSLANGCTSVHGVCGLGRLSLRSLAATGVFMAAGIATVFVTHHVLRV